MNFDNHGKLNKQEVLKMFTFTDVNGLQVNLFFEPNHKVSCQHVLVLVKRHDQYLCTIHKKRGVEFPGGKVEKNETVEEAAAREVWEETGVRISTPQWLAYYEVLDKTPFCKTVFIAEAVEEEQVPIDEETIGKLWLTEQELFNQPKLSFYMRDEGMAKILEYAHAKW